MEKRQLNLAPSLHAWLNAAPASHELLHQLAGGFVADFPIAGQDVLRSGDAEGAAERHHASMEVCRVRLGLHSSGLDAGGSELPSLTARTRPPAPSPTRPFQRQLLRPQRHCSFSVLEPVVGGTIWAKRRRGIARVRDEPESPVADVFSNEYFRRNRLGLVTGGFQRVRMCDLMVRACVKTNADGEAEIKHSELAPLSPVAPASH